MDGVQNTFAMFVAAMFIEMFDKQLSGKFCKVNKHTLLLVRSPFLFSASISLLDFMVHLSNCRQKSRGGEHPSWIRVAAYRLKVLKESHHS